MSEETTNKQEMPEQLSDILLVLDKEKMKIQAVKSIDENGKMETVDPTKKNQNQFSTFPIPETGIAQKYRLPEAYTITFS